MCKKCDRVVIEIEEYRRKISNYADELSNNAKTLSKDAENYQKAMSEFKKIQDFFFQHNEYFGNHLRAFDMIYSILTPEQKKFIDAKLNNVEINLSPKNFYYLN
ncbi:hypothetical protein [Desulforamulus aeronauticus]|uniref:Uncharacterized protein n=1 Tax=Desulforamulus aeronauticus DSM 10349 TaxID=1121421 RepID=A0A1M6SB89_9FIRM|nr:hypothetical protein [Desulforamulus aeronauticus]SHK41889.1 hypothetical protein SAMN02745123_01777 [Desulforamulus aeronauticus DSM 10349]